MAQYTEIESLDILIKAVQEYQADLATNKQILLNAANVCDVAMGSDAIAQKHIARLNETLQELQKTAQIASDVAAALIEDRRRALDTYED
jgi:Na+-transporting NADH:ubiquinone oxidoreductase subunit NqrC